jgi:hypothetical protein
MKANVGTARGITAEGCQVGMLPSITIRTSTNGMLIAKRTMPKRLGATGRHSVLKAMFFASPALPTTAREAQFSESEISSQCP